MKAAAQVPTTLCVLLGLLAAPLDARAKDIGTGAGDEPGARAPRPDLEPVRPMAGPLPDAPARPVEAPAQSTFDVRRLAIEGHLGFGTPVGAIGGIVEYAPVPVLGLGAGIGYGSGPSNGNHFHGALVARLRPLRGAQNALVLGLAYSAGGYARFVLNLGEGPGDQARTAEWAHWAQVDLGWERRTPKGFLIRLSLGGAVMLNPGDLRCPGSSSTSSCGFDSQNLLTMDLALGGAAIL